MKSLTDLLSVVLHDCGLQCNTDPLADVAKATARIEDEGVSFLGITLPAFAESFDQALDKGQVGPLDFPGFTRKSGLPLFLGGFLGQIFDSRGALLDAPNLTAVACIRQICLMWKKIQLPCAEERIAATFRKYVETDLYLPDRSDVILRSSVPGKPDYLYLFDEVSRLVWPNVLIEVENSVRSHELTPRHGPGATAERVKGNLKYTHRSWPIRVEPYFPFISYGTASLNEWSDRHYADGEYVDPGAETPVRVITVPKTLKGPRIIAIEPVTMQFLQQSLARPMMAAIEAHHLTRRSIRFRDQTHNQRAALAASRQGHLATVDLSEASDRVPLWLVERMLSTLPDLLGAVMACRSTRANVPTLEEPLPLRKFASMGSALCFPIESMVFYTICLTGMLAARGLRPSRRNVERLAGELTVYGDDLIFPVDTVEHILVSLDLFGLKVNGRKSFWTGKFRESCGTDAYDGVRVTPVYLRQMPPQDVCDWNIIPSFVSFGNQLYMAGYWGTAKYVREQVERLTGTLPMVRDSSAALGWVNVRGTFSIQGWDRALHTWRVRAFSLRTKRRPSAIDSYDALFKWFLASSRRDDVLRKTYVAKFDDQDHLVSVASSSSLSTKKRWTSPW